jgi:hypothetical protein
LRIVYDIGWQHLMSQASRHHVNRGQPFGQHAQQILLLLIQFSEAPLRSEYNPIEYTRCPYRVSGLH